MTLISQENVVAGLEMLKKRLLHLRTKCQYIMRHEPDGPIKELLLDEMEEEYNGVNGFREPAHVFERELIMDLRFYDLREDDFDDIIRLGNAVHGENYVDHAMLDKIYHKSCSHGLCCSKVVYSGPRKRGDLVGFRLTYAPGQWEIDEWCSTEKWEVPPEKVCYFKSNTVDENYRGAGLGGALLELSIATVKQMGAVAGITHIWMQSPGNSAFRYFSKARGQVLRVWPKRWAGDCEKDGYLCILHGKKCVCDASEMILFFGEQK